jgi:hypothetical protein
MVVADSELVVESEDGVCAEQLAWNFFGEYEDDWKAMCIPTEWEVFSKAFIAKFQNQDALTQFEEQEGKSAKWEVLGEELAEKAQSLRSDKLKMLRRKSLQTQAASSNALSSCLSMSAAEVLYGTLTKAAEE